MMIALNGEITGLACKWSEPFKKGKTTFNTRFADHSWGTKDANVSIEGNRWQSDNFDKL